MKKILLIILSIPTMVLAQENTYTLTYTEAFDSLYQYLNISYATTGYLFTE